MIFLTTIRWYYKKNQEYECKQRLLTLWQKSVIWVFSVNDPNEVYSEATFEPWIKILACQGAWWQADSPATSPACVIGLICSTDIRMLLTLKQEGDWVSGML